MIRDPSDGTTKHDGPICKGCGLPFYYDYTPRPSDISGYCENCFERKPSYTGLKAKHGDTWGINPPPDMPAKPSKLMTPDQLRDHYAIYNLAFEPKPEEGT